MEVGCATPFAPNMNDKGYYHSYLGRTLDDGKRLRYQDLIA